MQILEIDPSAELLEVIAYLDQSSEKEIRVCLPGNSQLARNHFNLRLLQYHATAAGKKIVIVSPHPEIQQMAGECGLPAVSRVEDVLSSNHASQPPASGGRVMPAIETAPLQAVIAKDSDPLLPWYRQPKWILIGTGSFLLLIFALVIFSSAKITLIVQGQPLASPVQIESAPGSGPVAVRTQSVQASVSANFPVASLRMLSGTPARGEVVFRNNCSAAFQLLPGQEVGTKSGVMFTLDKGTSRLSQGDSINLPVHAVQPGTSGNVNAGQVTSVANIGSQGNCLEVSNPDPISGGSEGEHQAFFSPADLQVARTALEQQAQQQITDQLNAGIRSGEKLSPTINYQPGDFKASAHPGDQVKSFGATLTITGEGAYYRPSDVDHAFADQLNGKAGKGKQLVDQGFKTDYQVTGTSGGRLTFKGTASGLVATAVGSNQVQDDLVGKSVGSARSHLLGLPGVRDVRIHQLPLPFPWMPFFGSMIQVHYQVDPGSTISGG